MPVSLSDQFYILDPAAPPSKGAKLEAQKFEMVDADEDGYIEPNAGDTFNGMTITRVWVGDTVTVNIPGKGDVEIEGVTFYVEGSPPVFTPTDGTDLQDATFVDSTYVVQSTKVALDDMDPVCFVRGSWIETPNGPRAVEGLKPGDLITTRDHGSVPLVGLYTGRFPAKGAVAPVRICKDALGNDQELWVSQQHRVLITGWRAELHFAAAEVLVAAKHLTNGDTIYIQEGGEVEYYHLLFDQHEIVQSAGLWSESYHPEHFMDRALPNAPARDSALPSLSSFPVRSAQTARPVVPGYAASLVQPVAAVAH